MNQNSLPLQVFRRKFSKELLDSMEDIIRSILGSSSLDAVLSKFQLEKLIEFPGELHRSLLSVFGQTGTPVLEKLVMKDLFRKCGLAYREVHPFDFESFVNAARREYSIASLRRTGSLAAGIPDH